MATNIQIFSIYSVTSGVNTNFYLIRTMQPGYSNSSYTQQEMTESIETKKRNKILQLVAGNYENGVSQEFQFVGEFQEFPVGDKLYSKYGIDQMHIWYIETKFGHPWVIIGEATSEDQFLNDINSDEDLLDLHPTGRPKNLRVRFVTENDFNLSAITGYNLEHIPY
ncbi:hypothetical protein [Dyadobacter psychrophilus]|nr:hypothetical protein [Dyadobacter psychrophilus]